MQYLSDLNLHACYGILDLIRYHSFLRFLLPCYHMKKHVSFVLCGDCLTDYIAKVILDLFQIHSHIGPLKF